MSKSISEKTRTALGWDDLLGHLSQLCHTQRGQDLARALPFCKTFEEV